MSGSGARGAGDPWQLPAGRPARSTYDASRPGAFERYREIDAALRHRSPSRSAAQHESDRREKRHHMTILDKLRADHRESVALLATIMAAGDEQQRNILFDQFVQEFVAQTKAEEKEFYEILRTYEDSR